ncbi:MAG TPA: hypothetical protein DC038_06775 [Clostridiales bacterium]|nr:hypothetical protein [Clostridiales bacterium]
MKILLKDQIKNYRFTVAKVVFLLIENRFMLIQDIKDSNNMLVWDKDKKEHFYISILGQPTTKLSEKYTNLIFYESRSYARNKDNVENEMNRRKVMKLSREFEMKFDEAIRDSFLSTESFFGMIPKEFQDIFEHYFSEAEKKILVDNLFFYKYLSKATVDDNKHNANDGNLAFSHPKNFNDPFDSNCTLVNNIDMSERFRVLCLTKEPVNILMWSYYSENHQGFCFEYFSKDIVNEIKKLEYRGLYIYGDITYSPKRPRQKSSLSHFSFTDLNFYIDAVYTKYLEWQHERESRFVALSDYHNTDFLTISPDINQAYKGCEGTGKDPINSKGETIKTKKIVKDNSAYSLIV